jgi:beta-1,4-mannosyltransferase
MPIKPRGSYCQSSPASYTHGCTLRVLASPYTENAAINPVQTLLYRSIEKLGGHVRGFSTRELLSGSWDIWHVHWPCEATVNTGTIGDAARGLIKFWLKLKLARIKRTKIFWTVHNIRPHDRHRPVLERFFWWAFIPNIDGVICMSDAGRRLLHEQHTRSRDHPTFVIPHGHYRGAYPDTISREAARQMLQIRADEFVITFIGQIRAYKGISHLVQAFRALGHPKARLIVTGMPTSNSLTQDLRDLAGDDANIQFYFEFIGPEDIQKFMRATDLVVLPYREILNSGSVMLALSFNQPVLVPAQGGLKELHQAVGSEWIRLYEGQLTPDTLRDAIQWTNARRFHVGRVAPLEEFSWDRIARLTMQAMQSTISK